MNIGQLQFVLDLTEREKGELTKSPMITTFH